MTVTSVTLVKRLHLQVALVKMIKFHQVLAYILIILVSSPCFAQWLPGKGDGNTPPGTRLWTAQNLCHETVLLALHFQTVDGKVITKGWYVMPPMAQLNFNMISEWIAYYARTQSFSYFWADPSNTYQGIGADLYNDFEYPGKGIGRAVKFYPYKG